MPAAVSTLVFISLTPNFGGHEVMLTRWMQEVQTSTSVTPYLICNPKSKLATLARDNGIACTLLNWPPAWSQKAPGPARKLLALAYLVAGFASIRRQTGAAVAVASEGSMMSEPLAILAARLVFKKAALYIPMVDTYQDLGYPDADGATRRFMRFYKYLPNAWVTLSQGQAEVFKRWSHVKQPVFVLQNTVSKAIEQAAEHTSNLTQSRSTFHVLVLGRLDAKHKGLDFLLGHLRQHARELLDGGLRFRLVGDGPYRQNIEESRQHDADLAQLLELQAWSDPIDSYRQADCTLIPSRYEGVPLVMLESMALRVPVVASRLPGIAPYLSPECLFEIGDLSKAISIIERLRERSFRQQVVDFNTKQYQAMASSEAFRNAAIKTTQEVVQLNN